ncbi:MAG: class I SAM-dependent methyltransferase [Candidatus Liptonbacteria bacterium]|nr:class I SAM-dependent methyltransferase [Candidatus Liptonbacteria bacterium]
MKEKLRALLVKAKEVFSAHGLELNGLHYFLAKQPQRKKSAIFLAFDATTHNPYFFGKEKYDNSRRIKLIELAYQAAGGTLFELFPEVCLDVCVRLEMPFAPSEVDVHCEEPQGGLVDVTHDNDVYFVELDELLKSGEVEKGSAFDSYCRKYGLKHILKHGKHHISPDTASVEALEAICDTQKVNSVLEIGGGVGTCGVAAERRGIKDYTFVDASPIVCNYLRDRFPSYKVINTSGLEFDFKRPEGPWDVVLMGMPYELNPWFLEKKGFDLCNNAKIVVFNSGCAAFFEFEHNWIAGNCWLFDKEELATWPWRSPRQTIPLYFHATFEARFDWQTCIMAGTWERLQQICKCAERRGFAPIEYQYCVL